MGGRGNLDDVAYPAFTTGQAAKMLGVQEAFLRSLDDADAFGLLRRTSQDLNVKLVDLAETLATRHRELDPETHTRED